MGPSTEPHPLATSPSAPEALCLHTALPLRASSDPSTPIEMPWTSLKNNPTPHQRPRPGLLRRGKTVLKGVGQGFTLRATSAHLPPPHTISPPTTPPPIADPTHSAPNVEQPHQQDHPYPPRVARIDKTGIVERSVAAAVISAARQRAAHRKPRPELPPHHRLHGGFTNPWPSALKDHGLRARGGAGSRTFFHKVAKDRRPPDELLASMLLLADRPDFDAATDALRKDKYALASTWIGHCTFVLQTRGLTILTDPVWSARLGPLGPRRLIPPPCEVAQLPDRIDVVVLTSACYDHFDKAAVGALSARVGAWLVPLGLKHLLVTAGVPDALIVELDWWQEHAIGDSKFVCTPAQHCSIRDDALWCSWVIQAPHHRIFFAGATGYRAVNREMEDSELFDGRDKFGGPCCPVFKEIYRRYGSCDTAFLPIGGFKPRLTMSGVQGDALDMLFIHRDLHARRSVAHRWGTFACNDEGMLDAVRDLEKALTNGPVSEHEFSYLKHGRVHVT